ncbi:hypothetical protein PsorP6_000750 [Peronosclerospora sorghi]|uniref:Uncharacterized protein n=1 Tax=Peronosclerospora sorghi TaxID=230839 RepID=A0ACC0WUE4_9STRA|nr:hypothetical protein PsorP6_000750 [Peronosclerospora sorghi]
MLAYTVVQTDNIRQVLQVAQDMGVEIFLTIDSVQGLEAAEKAATATGCVVNMLLHINVGYHRIGIEHDEPLLFYLAQPMDKSERIEFCGLLSHAGQAYQCMSVAECAHVAEAERQVMNNSLSNLYKLETLAFPLSPDKAKLTILCCMSAAIFPFMDSGRSSPRAKIASISSFVIIDRPTGAADVIIIQTVDVWPYTMTDSTGEIKYVKIPAFMMSSKHGKGKEFYNTTEVPFQRSTMPYLEGKLSSSICCTLSMPRLPALVSAGTWGEAPLVDSIDLDGWVAALRFCTSSGELVLHVKAKLYPFHAGDEL